LHEEGGWGIGDWGLGIGHSAQSPIPNPQSPIPNPQSPIPNYIFSKYIKKKIINNKYLILNIKKSKIYIIFNIMLIIYLILKYKILLENTKNINSCNFKQ